MSFSLAYEVGREDKVSEHSIPAAQVRVSRLFQGSRMKSLGMGGGDGSCKPGLLELGRF